ncbi:MAG: Gfo/Idh/MocA family oxidoreductase [Thaumarchaeota archaeon]|nr:Gfo/Idh/MocA family oxidoreductase [Nitrososphaerota archaeon]
MKAAVIGTGGWGKNHLRVFNELGILSCFAEIDEPKRKLYSSKYGVKGYANIDDMLKSGKPDMVSICTPTVTHFELAKKTMHAGVATLVEKPLTYSSKDGEALVKLATEKKVPLTVGFIERFNPAISELKKIIQGKMLGEPLLLEFHRENRWAGSIKDVGVVLDTSVHDIDTARWLFDTEPTIVFARTGKVISQHEDFAAIILGFDGQKTAFLVSNWVTPKRVRELVAVCTSGIVTADYITQEIRLDDSDGTQIPRRQTQEPLMIELKSFMEAVEQKKPPLVSGKDGVNTTKIAEAALASSEKGVPIYLNL